MKHIKHFESYTESELESLEFEIKDIFQSLIDDYDMSKLTVNTELNPNIYYYNIKLDKFQQLVTINFITSVISEQKIYSEIKKESERLEKMGYNIQVSQHYFLIKVIVK